jgi:membrane protein
VFQGVDRAMVLASQAFTALIPLLILVSATVPTGSEDLVSDAFVRRFKLAGQAATAVREVFAHSGDGSTGVLSVLLLVFSGVSLARRLQRMYLQAWGLDPLRGVRGSAYAALGLVALVVEIGVLSMLRSVLRHLPLDALPGLLPSMLASSLLWTSIPWLLLDRRVPWRRLLPAGALTGISTSVFGVATTIYMPELIESYSLQYGLFGVTLALVGWLLSVAMIVVTATVIAAELDRADEVWARRLRAWLGSEPAPDTVRLPPQG